MGHAPYFAVFTLTDSGVIQEGFFPNEHAGHHHHGADNEQGHHHGEDAHEIHEHQQQLGVVKECDAVIVRGIGPNMKRALLNEGLKIFRARKSLGSGLLELARRFHQDPGSFTEEH